ncbi:unannotated protein [freshwater metagenome]|uniref:Unannotated protein n=1 Tax=freshwater metagenome TaxID=449393 RepID=A0A6J7JEE2_9ZZZZ
MHAAWVALVAAVVLVALAPDGTSRWCAVLYGTALTAMFAASGLLHRGRWAPGTRRALRRLDHSLIHVFVAACSTTIALLVLDPPLRGVVLACAWAGAAAGVVLSVAWISAPRQLTSAVYVLVAGTALVGSGQLVRELAAVPTALLALGIVLYAAGAVVYATRRPNPDPLRFGYHEVFHLLVIAAATAHFAAFAGWIVPGGAPG